MEGFDLLRVVAVGVRYVVDVNVNVAGARVKITGTCVFSNHILETNDDAYTSTYAPLQLPFDVR